MRQITMTIPLHGLSKGESQLKIETSGFTGNACLDATKAVEKACGMVVEDQPTPEMFDTEEQQERLNNGG